MNYRSFPYYQEMTLELIFNNTIEIYRKYFGWLFFYSFLFLVILNSLSGVLLAGKLDNLEQLAEHPKQLEQIFGSLSLYMIVVWLGYSLIYLFLHYFIIGKYLYPEKSHATLFMESIRKYYLKYLLVIFLVFMIITLGTMAGLLALIIGAFVAAIFLGTSLFPVTPILIMENMGVGETIHRSFSLVLKDFWHVMGYLIVFYLIIILFSLIFSALSMAPYASGFFSNIFHPLADEMQQTSGTFQLLHQPLYILLNSFLDALLLPLTPIFSVLIYFHLKHKEDSEERMIVDQ